MFFTIIVFILTFGLIVLVHEIGHFVMAKRAGVRVDEFGIGLPPRLFSIKRGETIYSINLLPIGGFVKIHGEEGKQKRDQDQGRAFYSCSAWTRAKILLAGVTMNFLLAALLLGIGHWIGLPSIIEGEASGQLQDTKVQITQVLAKSPAEETGIKVGDEIKELKITGKSLAITTVGEVQDFVDAHQGEKITILIQRGDQKLEKELVPRSDPPENEGPMGIALARTAIVSYPWYQAIPRGISSAVNLTWLIIATFGLILWELITTGKLIVEVAGPVGIFDLTNQATQLGFIYILQFAAILNINLAIINALPFPALDGGRLLFLAIEKIKGSPVSQKIERYSHLIGFAILIALMIAVTWRDIIRIF